MDIPILRTFLRTSGVGVTECIRKCIEELLPRLGLAVVLQGAITVVYPCSLDVRF